MQKHFIFVRNYETLCSIGIYSNEKKNKQKIKISIRLGLKKLGNEDSLKSTVSYENIIEYLAKIKKFPHINLVETLAKKIVSHFSKFNTVNLIEVEIIKTKILNKKTDVGFFIKKSVK